MPELPEVEVSRQGVSPWLSNQTITNIVVRQRQMRWPVPAEISQAVGQQVLNVNRRAKYLLIEVETGTIVLHLGMSGKLRVVDASLAPVKHDHIDIVLGSGKCLRFNDPRRFGCFLWLEPGASHPLLAHLGPEPLSDAFDGERLYQLSRGKSMAIKPFIMDNAVVVGVGNIYATEALFAAGIDPRREAGRVSRQRYQRLAEEIKRILAKAIEQGGTTLRDFVGGDGQPGYFKQELFAYGRRGELCKQCGTTLSECRLGQRSTVFCRQCQR